MCVHVYTLHNACGHCLPKDPWESGPPPITKCDAVLTATHYYHDQPLYQSAEYNLESVIPMPKSCPPVFPHQDSETQESFDRWIHYINEVFLKRLADCGVTAIEMDRISDLAAKGNIDQRRKPDKNQYPRGLPPLPAGFFQFMHELAQYQAIKQKPSNIRFEKVPWGCGFPNLASPACTAGWTGRAILAYRFHAWNKQGALKKWTCARRTFCDALAIMYGNNHDPEYPTPRDCPQLVHVPQRENLRWILSVVPGPQPLTAANLPAQAPRRRQFPRPRPHTALNLGGTCEDELKAVSTRRVSLNGPANSAKAFALPLRSSPLPAPPSQPTVTSELNDPPILAAKLSIEAGNAPSSTASATETPYPALNTFRFNANAIPFTPRDTPLSPETQTNFRLFHE